MSKGKLRAALKAHKARQQAEEAGKRVERKVLATYPATHNPYLPHFPMDDCFSGCVHTR